MFVTKKALPRRTFLLGVGTTMALPLLESMVPAFTALAQTPAKGPLRFGAVYFPNGATNKHWFPDATSPGYEYKTILKPLEPFRNQVTSFGNLSRAGGKTVTDHAVSSAGWLTGAVAKQTEAEDIQRRRQHRSGDREADRSGHAASVDGSGDRGLQRLRRRVRAGLQLRLHEHHLVGVGDAVESDGDQSARGVRADVRAIGHAGRAPRSAFRKIAASSTRSPRKRAICSARSVPRDRARLGDYLDNVREIERRIQRTEAQNSKKVIAARRARSACPTLRRSRDADVRSACRGVPVRPDACVLVHDVA